MRKTPYFYTLLCTTMGGYTKLTTYRDLKLTILYRKISQTMLCQPHMIFTNICQWFKSIVLASGPTSVSVPFSGYLKFKLHDSNFSREKKVTVIATKITLQTQTGTSVSTNRSHYIFQDILHLSLLKLENTWLILHVPFP